MKTFDKLASIIGISAVIFCLIAVFIMRGRTGASQLASEIARKHQEDVYWLESDKSLVWYSVDVSKLFNGTPSSPSLRIRIVFVIIPGYVFNLCSLSFTVDISFSLSCTMSHCLHWR